MRNLTCDLYKMLKFQNLTFRHNGEFQSQSLAKLTHFLGDGNLTLGSLGDYSDCNLYPCKICLDIVGNSGNVCIIIVYDIV